MEKKKLKLTFCAGTGSVTGANFLIENEDKKFIIDCGLEQGTGLADETNWSAFPYDLTKIDILFVTHAHIDHIGRIPKLVHDGFRGRIISTDATHDLARPMLEDTIQILSHDEEHNLDKIYTHEILEQVMKLWEGVPYHQAINIDHGFTGKFLDSGHILGSAMLELKYNGKTIVFTGDLGNSPSPLLRDTEPLGDVDYLVMESVYGDRNHEDRDMRKKKLEGFLEDNYRRGGVLVVPTFSLERSQEMLFEINDLVEHKRIPQMPIFFDSPLAIKLTAVYRNYTHYFNDVAQAHVKSGDDIFIFPGLQSTPETDDSKAILHAPSPKVVIAGSGMSNGGRILHHELNYLPDEKNTLLLTGFQSLGTLGRTILEGAKSVRINGQEVAVKAQIAKIDGYSGHKDSNHLIQFVENVQDRVKKVFVVMGEPKSATFLVQRLRDYLTIDATAPEQGDVVELDF
ncbi:MAG: MBL fold metallo-hydrolase [bacterium]